MIKNIVFDLGQVLIEFNKDYFLDVFNVNGNDRKLLSNEVFFSKEWAMMDKGLIDEPEAYEAIKKNIPSRLHQAAYNIIFRWEEVTKNVEGMPEYIKELKDRGFNIYLLSNTSRRCYREYWKTFKGYDYFDGVVISALANCVKPQNEIYNYLLNKYNLKAEECVFIDDQPANICAAECNGIKGIVFHYDINELKIKLEQLL